jgi:hypothetical protein
VSGATGLRSVSGAGAAGGGGAGAAAGAAAAGAYGFAGSTSPSGAAPAGLALSPNAAGSRPTAITRLHASRSYIVTKRHGSHAIVVTFRLRHRARVFFTLVQVAPKCRVVASFSVIGHRGTNRIRLGDGAGRRKLPPGTYRLAARTPHGSSLLYTTVLVTNHRPTRAELASAMQANACAAAVQLASVRLVRGAIASIFGSPPGTGSLPAVSKAPAGAAASGTLGVAARAQPDLGAFSPANLAKNATDPLAIAALGAALLLLGLAALPRAAIPDPRLTDLIVRYRAEVVVAGAAAFAAAVIALTVH